jgi:hypothetical protein
MTYYSSSYLDFSHDWLTPMIGLKQELEARLAAFESPKDVP